MNTKYFFKKMKERYMKRKGMEEEGTKTARSCSYSYCQLRVAQVSKYQC